ncbi:unnamed protein product, partial [marine sediment metagenome]
DVEINNASGGAVNPQVLLTVPRGGVALFLGGLILADDYAAARAFVLSIDSQTATKTRYNLVAEDLDNQSICIPRDPAANTDTIIVAALPFYLMGGGDLLRFKATAIDAAKKMTGRFAFLISGAPLAIDETAISSVTYTRQEDTVR